MLKTLTLGVATVALAGVVGFAAPVQPQAACVGSGSYQSCTDQYGNSYSIQRYGNQTQMQGYNSQTGSSWSQHSTTMGNTTFHNGWDSDGDNWNSTTTQNGNFRSWYGTDSDGNSFQGNCAIGFDC